MKKLTSLILIYFVAFGLFSQSDTTGINMQGDTLSRNSPDDAETMFELGVGNVVVMGRGDTLNLDGPTVLSNGHPLGSDPVINTSVYNVLRSYDAEQREATGSDDYMFIDAFSKSKIIWIPNDVLWPDTADAQYLISGTVVIPYSTELMFDIGAMIDVTGLLQGQYTYIDADIHQIFTITSNLSTEDYDWASSNHALPEWFGANPIGNLNARDAIQKCVDVFKRNIVMEGLAYFIEGTIELNSANTIKIASLTTLVVSAGMPDAPLFKITESPFVIEGGLIEVMEGYHGWIFDVAINKINSSDRLPRFTSSIENIIIRGYDQGGNYSGKAFKGIRVRSAKETDYSYFATMNQVEFFRSDTAIFLSGNPVSGMSNSWHWSNITLDGTMKGIILDHRAAGHVFSSLIIQPNTWQHQFSEAFIIDVNSSYNVFNGMIWDIANNQKVIRIGPKASNNWFSSFGHVNLYRDHVKDERAHKGLNIFSTSNPFEPTKPNSYNYSTHSSISIGSGGLDNTTGAAPLSVFRSTSPNNRTPTINVVRKTVNTGGDLNSTQGTNNAISIITQKTNGAHNNRGHGGGIDFLSKHTGSDTTGSSKYNNNVMARLYGRKDKNGAANDNRGLFQIFTKGENATHPTMTLRNSGFVGIGTTDPKSTLQVNGGIQLGDDTDAASADKAGTVRYRSDSNNSYVEMCVQTGASTYEWIILHQKTW